MNDDQQPELTPRDAAQQLLGDASLADQVMVINGQPLIKGVPVGPPARWAADPQR